MRQNISRPQKSTPKIILLVVTSRGYHQGILRGIANYCNTHGLWDIHLDYPLPVPKVLKLVESMNADGLIAHGPYLKHVDKPTADFSYTKGLDELSKALDIPIITFTPDSESQKLHFIYPDNFRTGVIAAEFFIGKGFNSYAFCGYKDIEWSRKRFDGFCETLKNNHFNAFIYEQNYEQTQETRLKKKDITNLGGWLMKLARPAAVFACNDDRARDVIESCRLTQLKVPDDIAVLGADNDAIKCDLFNPPISSIAFNTERAGYQAAELLETLINGQEPPLRTVIVQPKYVLERQSTDIFAVEDDVFAEALEFISHSEDLIQVSDVADVLAVPRRTLELRFRKSLNRTIGQEINRIKVERICKLLLEEELSISQIANQLGYLDSTHIARFFKKEKGITPHKFREQYRSSSI